MCAECHYVDSDNRVSQKEFDVVGVVIVTSPTSTRTQYLRTVEPAGFGLRG